MYRHPESGELVNGIKKVNYTHEACADIILANPAINQNDLAAHFGYSASWISQVLASDAFQAYIATRKEEIVDPILRGAIEEGLKGLVLRSIEVLRGKLDANPTGALALGVLNTATRAAGYGARVQIDARVKHEHSLIGVLSGLPPPERVVSEQ